MIVFGLLSSVFDMLTFLTLRLGFHASATLSRSGWFIEFDHHRTRRHARPAHQPAPSTKATPALLSSIAIAAITITLPYSPLAGPLGLTAVPAWILAALARLTAFYVIANEGPNLAPTDDPITNPALTVALDELIASTPRGRCHLGLPAWQAASCGRDAGKSRRPPCRSSRPARTSSSAGGAGSA